MAYTTIDLPTDYFNTKLYTGTGSSHAISGIGFQPDWVWTKKRSNTGGHIFNDAVRGSGKHLFGNLSNAEATYDQFLTSFNSDGFTVGNDAEINQSGQTYVSWNWKAGGSASSNSNGSITTSVSANTTAGFSIVSWTHNGSNGTIGHGLGTAPQVVITKERNSTGSWNTFHVSSGNGNRLVLQGTNANISTSLWNSTSPTNSVFSFNDGLTSTMIAYCFAEKKGYSKFGTYSSNNSLDGPFIFTGFKPAFFMTKRTDVANSWVMFDNKRDPHNEVTKNIYANASDAEETDSNNNDLDFLSNGIKLREDNNGINASGGTYIYMAFAESPFVTSTGIPTTAR